MSHTEGLACPGYWPAGSKAHRWDVPHSLTHIASCGPCLQLGGQLRSLHKLPVGYVALDWHQMDKELGSEALVEAFWTQLSALLPPQVSLTRVQRAS